jgi:hypothetical protein
MSNKIVRRGDALLVTWLDSEYRNVVADVNPEDGTVESGGFVGQGFDNHCGAAMARTPDGMIHVVNGSHHRGFVYRCSDDPKRPDSWSPPEAVGCRPTYPSLISDLDGNLHLTHRYSPMYGGHWGAAWCRKEGRKPWQMAYFLVEAPATGYTYPTNALGLAPDGTVHLILEWYKTYPDNIEPPRTMAVGHFENPGGETWHYSDGREVKCLPIGIEDSDPIVFCSAANFRPGNIAVLPDNRPVVAMWDAKRNRVFLALRGTDLTWQVTDLSESLASPCGGSHYNGTPQVAVTPGGDVVLVIARAADEKWGDPSTQLHVFRLKPDSGEVLQHEPVEKTDPDEPDWLASIEKEVLGEYREDPYLTYITGRRGTGCINDAVCRVKMVHLI